MRSKSHTISVIIISAGNTSFISRCVSSVVNQLTPKDELLVVSKRKITPIPLPAHAVRYIHASNSTKGQARNIGIAKAKNTFVAFIDDDCVAATDWVKQIKANIKDNVGFIQGQTDNGEETNLWSTIENATLHVYKNLPDRREHMEGAGIKFDAENLVINRRRIPFRPLFIESPHWYVHDDYLLLLRLNTMGIRTTHKYTIRVTHEPHSTFIDYIKKLIIDGRSEYWKSYVLKRKRDTILKHFAGRYRIHHVDTHPFNRLMENQVIAYIHDIFPDQRRQITFLFFWKLKFFIRKVGFAIEQVSQFIHPSTDIEHYLFP